MQAPKNGFFYVLDRLTGEFISASRSARRHWATGLDAKTGRPIESRRRRYGLTPVTLSPGPPGAHNWQPMSFHPGTGLVVFPVRTNAFQYSIDPAYGYNKGGRNLGRDRRSWCAAPRQRRRARVAGRICWRGTRWRRRNGGA